MLKLFTKSINTEKPDILQGQINQIKIAFHHEVQKPRFYKEKSFLHHSYEEGIEKCFLKFAIGKPDNHETENFDYNRLTRLHWIHLIIDYMIKHSFNDPEISPNKRITCHFDEDENTLFLFYEKYNYVIIINVRVGNYLIGTAYPIKSDNMITRIKNLPIYTF